MSYLGKIQFKSSDVQRFDVTSSTSATHVLSWTAPNEQSLIITINGVKQQDDAYSIAGSPTTVTLTDALITTDKLEIVGIIDVGTMNVPGVGSVQTDQLANDAVTSAKIVDGAIVNADINASAAIVQSKLATLAITDSEVADNALSGNKIDGGTISDFASTGIDDNADAVAMTINSSEIVGVGTALPLGTRTHIFGSGTAHVASGSDGTRELIVEGANIPLTDSMGNIAVISNTAQAADTGGQIALMGKTTDSDNRASTHAVIKGAKENSTTTNIASYLAFSTRVNGAGNTEKLRINSVGNMLLSGSGSVGISYVTIADDAVASFTPGSNRGMIFAGGSSTHMGAAGYVCINGGSQESYLLLNTAGTFAVGTGVPTGTTGTDVKFTIFPANDGKIYFENRLGGSFTVWYFTMGLPW